MANAQTKAPLPEKEKVLTAAEKQRLLEAEMLERIFDPEKKYMFELAEQNLERELPVWNMATKRPEPHKRFKPFQNIVLTSQVVWGGQRRNVRYYDGCTSIFQDEQPKEKDVVDQLMKQTRPRVFLEGKFGCYGDERMLLIYLSVCSWNTDSPFRTKTANQIFKSSNPDRFATEESNRMDAIEEAMKFAREATETKMRIHANYLRIPEIDYDSGNELTLKEIRTLYRKEAANNPTKFIESYGNKSIELKYFIDKALERGIITNTFNANRATWKNSNTEICDISGLKSHDAISERLFEFSQTGEAGEEFEIQLKALFN